MLKNPGFSAAVVLTLALGIGADTAMFSVIRAVLLRPLAFRDPDRVVLLWSHWTNWTKTWVSEPELADYQRARSLEHVAGFSATSFNLTGGPGSEPLRVVAAQVQAAMFDALGAQPIVGRVFTSDEDRPGRAARGPRAGHGRGSIVRLRGQSPLRSREVTQAPADQRAHMRTGCDDFSGQAASESRARKGLPPRAF